MGMYGIERFMRESVSPPSEFVIWLRGMVWRVAWSHQDEEQALRQWGAFVDETRGLAASRNWTNSPLCGMPRLKSLNGLDSWRFPFSKVITDVAASVMPVAIDAEVNRQMVIAALGLKRYQLRNGQYPEKLDALVPDYLQTVLQDWMDGKPLRYKLNTDGSFKLYSVGENGKDEAGDATTIQGDNWGRIPNGNVWPLVAADIDKAGH